MTFLYFFNKVGDNAVLSSFKMSPASHRGLRLNRPRKWRTLRRGVIRTQRDGGVLLLAYHNLTVDTNRQFQSMVAYTFQWANGQCSECIRTSHVCFLSKQAYARTGQITGYGSTNFVVPSESDYGSLIAAHR
jgi:hypothetical protein